MSRPASDDFPLMESAPATHAWLSGRECLYFAGTGYLALQGHPAVIAAAEQACVKYGIHTATTRSGYGTSPPVLEVERRTATFLGAEECCYLVSGYAVNFALAAALSKFVDLVLIDESAHDCLREATHWLTELSRPPLAFRHRDPQHMSELLAPRTAPRPAPAGDDRRCIRR